MEFLEVLFLSPSGSRFLRALVNDLTVSKDLFSRFCPGLRRCKSEDDCISSGKSGNGGPSYDINNQYFLELWREIGEDETSGFPAKASAVEISAGDNPKKEDRASRSFQRSFPPWVEKYS